MTQVSSASNNVVQGSLFLGGAAILFPVKDALVKSIGGSVSPLEIAATYFAVQAVVAVSWLLYTGSQSRLSSIAAPSWLLLTRSTFMVMAIVLFFAAVQTAPLAEAVVLFTTNALFIVILGAIVLREHVSASTVVAVILGFGGVLLVIRPTLSNLPDPHLILALGSALAYASFMIATRKVGEVAEPVQMLLLDGVIGTVLCSLATFALATLSPFEVSLHRIEVEEAWRLVASGAIGTVSALFVIRAMKSAPASKIAAWGYIEIPSAVFIGVVAFGEHLDVLSLAGAAIIVLSCYLAAKRPAKRDAEGQSNAIN